VTPRFVADRRAGGALANGRAFVAMLQCLEAPVQDLWILAQLHGRGPGSVDAGPMSGDAVLVSTGFALDLQTSAWIYRRRANVWRHRPGSTDNGLAPEDIALDLQTLA
jgi:hypothetical protein